METKYITIPFNVERARSITSGVEPGKIVTRDGKEVRIVCFDVKNDKYPIIGLVKEGDKEAPETFKKNGIYTPAEKECEYDLFLSVPEWTTFKDGDVVTMGWGDSERYCIWISIIKNISKFEGIETASYVSLCLSGDEKSIFPLMFDDFQACAQWARKSTEIEIKELIEAIKGSKDPRAKECLKKLGIEEKKEFDLKPFDKVLVRDDDGVWFAGIFSHLRRDGQFFCAGGNLWEQCLPYNDQTKHLLGTTDDLEG